MKRVRGGPPEVAGWHWTDGIVMALVLIEILRTVFGTR